MTPGTSRASSSLRSRHQVRPSPTAHLMLTLPESSLQEGWAPNSAFSESSMKQHRHPAHTSRRRTGLERPGCALRLSSLPTVPSRSFFPHGGMSPAPPSRGAWPADPRCCSALLTRFRGREVRRHQPQTPCTHQQPNSRLESQARETLLADSIKYSRREIWPTETLAEADWQAVC